MRVLIVLAVLGVVFAADVYFTQAGGNKQVSGNVGEALTVRLEGIPSTGYSWTLEQTPEDVEVTDSGFTAPNAALAGQKGVFHFTLTAAEAGTHELTFVYRRSWESVAPAATAVVTFIVSGDNSNIKSVRLSSAGGNAFIQVNTFDEFRVDLEILRGSTGYNWEVTPEGQDLATTRSFYDHDHFSFYYKANKHGNYKLKFQLRRPWESTPASFAEVTVLVIHLAKEAVKPLVLDIKQADVDRVLDIQRLRLPRTGGSGNLDIILGQQANIEIEANPSTGYSWAVQPAPDGEPQLVASDTTYTSTGNVPGKPGFYTFVYNPTEVGTYRLIFHLRRPWEKVFVAVAEVILTVNEEEVAPLVLNIKQADVDRVLAANTEVEPLLLNILDGEIASIVPDAGINIHFPVKGGRKETRISLLTRQITVTLDGNPTTGYSWQLLSQLPEGVTLSNQNIGSAGNNFNFVFNVRTGEDQFDIEFGYLRVWESVPPAQRAVLHVINDLE